jgi:hypothetical protein
MKAYGVGYQYDREGFFGGCGRDRKKTDPILISGGLLGVRPTLSLHFVSCSGEYRQCSFDHIVTRGQ